MISQIGGKYVNAEAIMSNPTTDPHTFEASPAVAREVSAAQLVVQNGVGYDTFMSTIESADPNSGRKVINVQQLLGLPDSTPNPHLWYKPTTMPTVANAIAADLAQLDPAHASYFKANAASFITSLSAGAVELYLNHLADGPGEYVVVDCTAGVDSFASGLSTRFDLTVLVAEPTRKGISVYRQWQGYAAGHDVALVVAGNNAGRRDCDHRDLHLRDRDGSPRPGLPPAGRSRQRDRDIQDRRLHGATAATPAMDTTTVDHVAAWSGDPNYSTHAIAPVRTRTSATSNRRTLSFSPLHQRRTQPVPARSS